MVIGFSGSSLTQQISSYGVYGTTTNNVTTFTSPILLKQGTGIYAGYSNANVSSAIIATTSTSPFGNSTFTSTGTDTATITVQLGSPAGAAGVVVDLGFSGTAVANRDYKVTDGTNSVNNAVGAPVELLIPAGQTSGSIVLTGLNNTTAIGDETVNVSVTSINGTPPAATTSTSLTLVDAAAPIITAENLSATETSATGTSTATGARAAVRAGLDPRHGRLFDQRTARPSNNVDYTALSNQTVTFAPGQTVAAINVTLDNNTLAEGKTFTINFSQPTLANNGRGTLATTSATVTLLNTTSPTYGTLNNSSGPAVTIAPSAGSFTENSGTVTMTATLSAPSTTDTLVNLSFGGAATFGTDYVASGESIFIPAGQTTGSVTLTGNDVAIPAAGLSVTVGIQSVYGGTTGSPSSATVNLGPGTVASSTISGQVTGNAGGMAGVIVYLSPNSTLPRLRDQRRFQSGDQPVHDHRRQRQLLLYRPDGGDDLLRPRADSLQRVGDHSDQ